MVSPLIDALPEEVKPIINALIEGRCKQILIIMEVEDGCILDGYSVITDDSNKFAMIGAIESVKRDYMRAQIESRIRYVQEDGE